MPCLDHPLEHLPFLAASIPILNLSKLALHYHIRHLLQTWYFNELCEGALPDVSNLEVKTDIILTSSLFIFHPLGSITH